MVPTARVPAWDIQINGTPFKVHRDEKGAPVWGADQEPELIMAAPMRSAEEAHWTNWSSGYGYKEKGPYNTYDFAEGVDCRFEGRAFLGPKTTKVADLTYSRSFVECYGRLFCVAASTTPFVEADLCEINLSTWAVTRRGFLTFGTKIFKFDDVLYVLNAIGVMQRYNSDNTLTNGTINARFAAVFEPDGVSSLAVTEFAANRDIVRWAPSGSDILSSASYTANYNVGEATTGVSVTGGSITGMVGIGRTLFIARNDGLYYIDQYGNSPCVLKMTKPNGANGAGLFADSSGYVWYPSREGLFRYDPRTGVIEDCTPAKSLSVYLANRGRVRCLAQHRGWYYGSLENGSGSGRLICGRERKDGEPGTGPIAWHCGLVNHGDTVVGDDLFVTSLTATPKLVVSGPFEDTYLHEVPLVTDYPMASSAYRYANAGSLYLSEENLNVPGARWYPTEITVDASNVTANRKLLIYLHTENMEFEPVESRQLLGTIVTPGQQTLKVPTTGGTWFFHRARIMVGFVTDTDEQTPILHSLTLRAIRRPPIRPIIRTTLICSDRANSNFGIGHRVSGKDQIDALIGVQETTPVDLEDWWTGSKRTRKVLVMPVKERVAFHKEGLSVDQAVEVTMVVLE